MMSLILEIVWPQPKTAESIPECCKSIFSYIDANKVNILAEHWAFFKQKLGKGRGWCKKLLASGLEIVCMVRQNISKLK